MESTSNLDRAKNLLAEASKLLGRDNQYSQHIRMLLDEYEGLYCSIYHSRGWTLTVEVKTIRLNFYTGTKSMEMGLHVETIKELLRIYWRKLGEACEETEAIINKLKA